MIAAAAWTASPYFRQRAASLPNEIANYRTTTEVTSAGERIQFWTKSISFIESAPLLGHGTGTIRDQFTRAAAGQAGMAGEISANPHNQILAVGIQLGTVGMVLLLCVWAAHLALFWADDLPSWIGFVVVVENVLSSLFNSHLFDFMHGWLYVVGVGVAAGEVFRRRDVASSARR